MKPIHLCLILALCSRVSASNATDAAAFVSALKGSFAAWDTDHDSTLARLEIDTSLADPAIKGDAAAVLAVVKRLARSKTWGSIPRTLDGLSALATGPMQKADPNLAGMFDDGRKRIGSS